MLLGGRQVRPTHDTRDSNTWRGSWQAHGPTGTWRGIIQTASELQQRRQMKGAVPRTCHMTRFFWNDTFLVAKRNVSFETNIHTS